MINKRERLLILIEGHIPTVDIIIRCLYAIQPGFSEIKMLTLREIKQDLLLSGEYKLLFVRTCNPAWRPIINLMYRFNVHYIYYIDDNFWELKGETPIAKCYQDKAVINTLNKFVHGAYLILTSTNCLADYIRMQGYSHVMHVNAAFDFSLIRGLKQIRYHEKVKILYAGSLYRDQDFKEVNQALQRISNEYCNQIMIDFYGYIPSELSQLPNIRHEKNYYPYDEYIKKQYDGHYDIGLAPLADTISNQSKSNLKYREYGACHIAGIYTNIHPYQECIIDKQNGLLVEQTSLAWYQAIKLLIDNAALRNKIKTLAFRDIKSHYSTNKVAFEWKRALSMIPENKKYHLNFMIRFQSSFSSKAELLLHLMNRTIIYFRSHGMMFTLKKGMTYLLNLLAAIRP